MKCVSPFRFHFIELLVVFLLGNASPSSAVQNLLADPGFESGAFASNPLVGWGPVNAASFSQDYSHSGLWSLKDHYDSSGIGPVVAGTQIVPASPSLTYSLSGWAFTPVTLNNVLGLLLIDFLDSSQQLINYNGTTFYVAGGIDASAPAQTWNFLSGSATAPPGTAYVQVEAELFNLAGGSPSNVVYFDDLNLMQVPEPASLVLVAMCLGLSVSKKRRTHSA